MDVKENTFKPIKRKQAPSPHIQGADQPELSASKKSKKALDSGHLPSAEKGLDEYKGVDQPRLNQSGIQVLGEGARQTEFTSFENKQRLSEVNRKGKTAYGLRYIHDQFSYQDANDVFRRSFQEASGSVQGGLLMIGGERFLWRKYIDISAVGNIGVGYNKGPGIFLDGQTSRARFQLWTLPIDLGLGIGIPVGQWLTLHGSAGPSALGLIQTRSDRPRGDSEREKRQYSHGYFAEARVKFNLSRIFPKLGFDVYRDYDASNFYFDILARKHQYEYFKDDLIISGESLGIGFTFDFL